MDSIRGRSTAFGIASSSLISGVGVVLDGYNAQIEVQLLMRRYERFTR